VSYTKLIVEMKVLTNVIKILKELTKRIIVIDSISDIEYARKIQRILSPLDFVRESAIKQWITKSKTIHIHGIFYRGDLVGVRVYREKPSYLQIRHRSSSSIIT